MRQWVVVSWLAVCLCLASPIGAQEKDFTFDEWMHFGRRALLLGHYDKAKQYFHKAEDLSPQDGKPRKYLNFIKRLEDGRTAVIEFKDGTALTFPPVSKKAPAKPKFSTAPPLAKSSLQISEPIQPTKAQYHANRDRLTDVPSAPTQPEEEYRLSLDDELWQRQPNMQLVIERGQSIIFEGRNIERSLILTEGFIEVQKNGLNELRVTGINKGITFFYLWDDRGRWTFHIQVDFPRRQLPYAAALQAEKIQASASPFRVSYSNNWNSYYLNDNFSDLQRQNLTFSQVGSFVGPTPYGLVDGFATLNKFDLSTEVTGYGAGLANGRLGTFKDFSIRGGDTSRRFSELSLPGKYFRGGYLDAYAFDRRINYTYLRGKDRSVFNFVSPGSIDEKRSYIEGAQITLWPDGPHRYSANFARGFGVAREDFLKDRVISLETEHDVGNFHLNTEIAHDESAVGKIARSLYDTEDLSVWVNFRDIESDFVTVTSIPSGRGEIGGQFNVSYHPGRFLLASNLDLFRDRFLSNLNHPDDINTDYNAQMSVPLTELLSWRSSFFYVDTPGQLSPRTSVRGNSQLTQSFHVWQDQLLSVFVGGSAERNRFEEAPASEYDSKGYVAGIRVPIVRWLDVFANYNYDWVDVTATGETVNPNALSSGINMSHNFTPRLNGHINVTYRNEEGTGSSFSFLAGEDSVTNNIGLSYHPVPDTELFADGRLRTVWSEIEEDTSFVEADLRFGVRTGWNLPFRWSKYSYVGGIIFKDLNKNQRYDEGEPGIPDIKVQIGNSSAVTDADGEYYIAIRAESARVNVDVDSIPEGYVIDGPLTRDVNLTHHDWQLVDFGLSTQSGIYGVVFYDRNGNGKTDPNDEFVSHVKLTLDGETSTFSDFEGAYFFENIPAGEHTVEFDINSIPIKYLPMIKVKNQVKVEEGSTYVLPIPLKLQAETSDKK